MQNCDQPQVHNHTNITDEHSNYILLRYLFCDTNYTAKRYVFLSRANSCPVLANCHTNLQWYLQNNGAAVIKKRQRSYCICAQLYTFNLHVGIKSGDSSNAFTLSSHIKAAIDEQE